MRTTLSSQMLAAMHAESSGEIVLPLVKLTQVGWEAGQTHEGQNPIIFCI